MKRRFLALATALVMIIGLLPATILTVSAEDTPTYQSFSGASLCNDVTVSDDGYTATITDTDSSTGTNQIYLYDVFAGMTNPHMTQTIQINSMPVFTGIANSGNAHQSSGYFNVMEGPRTKPDGVNWNEPYVRYSIFRADDAGNLKLTIFKNNYANGGAAVTDEDSYTVDLNKKLTDEFTLTTVWNDHNTVSFYCGGSLLGTYEDVTYNRDNYGGLDALFFGYLPHLANTTDYAATTEIIVKNMIIADGHTPGEHDGICTSPITCTSCGAVTTPGKDHTFNQKVATSAYLKEDNTFYTSCACGTSSAGKVGEATFTAVDISGATKSNYYTLNGNYAVTLNRDNHTYAGNDKVTDLDDFTLNSLTAGLTEVHLSQTITIDNMTKFDRTIISGNYYQHNGFYNVFFRNRRYVDPENTNSLRIADWLMYTIQRRDDDGSLYLILAYSPESSMNAAGVPTFTYNDAVALGKKLGETFRLTTVWNEDNSVDFYIDGELLVSYEAAKALTVQKATGASVEYFRFGYFDAFPVETGYEGTAKMTVSALAVNDGCIAEEDDGDCTTAVKCAECGEVVVAGNPNHTAAPKADTYCTTDTVCVNCGTVMVEGADAHTPNPNHNDCSVNHVCAVEGCNYVIAEAGSHTPGADDGNCVTPVMCSVCGREAVAGHTLTHVAEVPATNTTDGMKAHYKCETCEVLYATEDGTGGVVDAASLVIPKLAGKVEVEDATITDAIESAGDGDVSLDVTDAEYTTSSVQMSNASLAVLEQLGKSVIITTDEGVVTVNPAALDAIKAVVDTAENMAIKMKQEEKSVLAPEQITALAEYATVRTVVKAELYVAGTETAVNFGEGTVTVKIPFTPGNGVNGSAYKLVYVSDDGETVEDVVTTYETGYLIANLKHFSDYVIVSNEVEEERISQTITEPGSVNQTVTGTYIPGASGTVFSVDVNWGSLNFKYQDTQEGIWNPATHEYVDRVEAGWVTNNEAFVEVVNHSNAAINVAVTKNAEELIAGVGVNLTNAEGTLKSGTETTYITADSLKTTIVPYGELTEGQKGVVIARITVTITAVQQKS